MARRPKQRLVVHDHPIESREIRVLGADWPGWSGQAEEPLVLVGSIVFIEPPAGTSPHDIEALKDRIVHDCGAATVRVLPRASGKAAIPEAVVASDSEEDSIREVVFAMAAECKTVSREKLVEALDEALGKAGL